MPDLFPPIKRQDARTPYLGLGTGPDESRNTNWGLIDAAIGQLAQQASDLEARITALETGVTPPPVGVTAPYLWYAPAVISPVNITSGYAGATSAPPSVDLLVANIDNEGTDLTSTLMAYQPGQTLTFLDASGNPALVLVLNAAPASYGAIYFMGTYSTVVPLNQGDVITLQLPATAKKTGKAKR